MTIRKQELKSATKWIDITTNAISQENEKADWNGHQTLKDNTEITPICTKLMQPTEKNTFSEYRCNILTFYNTVSFSA